MPAPPHLADPISAAGSPKGSPASRRSSAATAPGVSRRSVSRTRRPGSCARSPPPSRPPADVGARRRASASCRARPPPPWRRSRRRASSCGCPIPTTGARCSWRSPRARARAVARIQSARCDAADEVFAALDAPERATLLAFLDRVDTPDTEATPMMRGGDMGMGRPAWRRDDSVAHAASSRPGSSSACSSSRSVTSGCSRCSSSSSPSTRCSAPSTR